MNKMREKWVIDQIEDRYALGFNENWAEILDLLVDLQNAGNLDEMGFAILKMRLDGYSFRDIGDALGISHNTAIKKLRSVFKDAFYGNKK